MQDFQVNMPNSQGSGMGNLTMKDLSNQKRGTPKLNSNFAQGGSMLEGSIGQAGANSQQ